MQLNIMKKKKTIKKMGRRHKWIDISTKKTEKRPRSPEKMLNIASYQRNLNQNYDEMLPPISQQAITTKNPKPTYAERGAEKREPSYTVGGM